MAKLALEHVKDDEVYNRFFGTSDRRVVTDVFAFVANATYPGTTDISCDRQSSMIPLCKPNAAFNGRMTPEGNSAVTLCSRWFGCPNSADCRRDGGEQQEGIYIQDLIMLHELTHSLWPLGVRVQDGHIDTINGCYSYQCVVGRAAASRGAAPGSPHLNQYLAQAYAYYAMEVRARWAPECSRHIATHMRYNNTS
ncbi:MAG: hypothetical protein M1832_001558 [Thelocarpon impressellum]|nr:MAG: hypothetical protein M1832_001558 [Thelocarpon impressellum]